MIIWAAVLARLLVLLPPRSVKLLIDEQMATMVSNSKSLSPHLSIRSVYCQNFPI